VGFDAWLSPASSTTRQLPSSSSCPTRTRSFPAFSAPSPFNSDRHATTSELSPALCAFRRPLTSRAGTHTGGCLSCAFDEGVRLGLGRRAGFVAFFTSLVAADIFVVVVASVFFLCPLLRCGWSAGCLSGGRCFEPHSWQYLPPLSPPPTGDRVSCTGVGAPPPSPSASSFADAPGGCPPSPPAFLPAFPPAPVVRTHWAGGGLHRRGPPAAAALPADAAASSTASNGDAPAQATREQELAQQQLDRLRQLE